MLSSLAITLISICLNVFSGCNAPVYKVGDMVTTDVHTQHVAMAYVGKSDIVTITVTFADNDNIEYTTSITATTKANQANLMADVLHAITKMTISGKVTSAQNNAYTLADVKLVKSPSMTEKAWGTITDAANSAKNAMSNATSRATTATRQALANSLISLANTVKP